MPNVKIGMWLLTEDDRYLGRYLLFRARRQQWVFVCYLRTLKLR